MARELLRAYFQPRVSFVEKLRVFGLVRCGGNKNSNSDSSNSSSKKNISK